MQFVPWMLRVDFGGMGTLSIQLGLFSVAPPHNPVVRKLSMIGYCDGINSSATKIQKEPNLIFYPQNAGSMKSIGNR